MDRAKGVIEAFNKCAKARINWETLYSDCYQYTLPFRDNFNHLTDGGENNNREILDSTALDALNKFTSNIQSSLIPPGQVWASLIVSDAIPLEDKKGMQENLDLISKVLFSNLHKSDFDMEISSALQDVCFGTGCIMIQRGTPLNPLQVKAIPLPELYIEKVGNGKYSNVFRQHKIRYKNIIDFWSDAKLPSDIQDKDKEAVLIEYIRKENNKYQYTVVDFNKQFVIVERELAYNPFIIFRWSVTAGEVYGRGPVLQALPDIKSLNKTKELVLKNAALAVTGIYLADEDNAPNLKNIKLVPGSVIPCTMTGAGGDPLRPLQNNCDFNVGDIIIKDLRQSIRDIMFADALGPVDLPVKSATEISYRQQNLAKQIGAAYGRLNNELVRAVINVCLHILDELNLIKLDGITLDDGLFDLNIKSPLSFAQSEEDVNKLLRFAQSIVELFGPQLALGILKPEIIEELSSLMGIPQRLIRDPQEIAQLLGSITQQAQQQQEMVQNV